MNYPMADKCPGCKAEATAQHRTSDWFECGSHLQHDLPGDVPDRFIESEHCLRNQLAKVNAEIEQLRKIILDAYKAECDSFYDDPRNSGHPLPKNPLED